MSEHGLGLYLNPTDIESADRSWIRQTWQHIVDLAHGISSAPPAWLNAPALTRTTVSSPHVLQPFADYNNGKSYADRVKPFNFLLVVSELRPIGENRPPRRFVAPYTTSPAEWSAQDWRDLHDPSSPPIRIVTNTEPGDEEVRVKSHRQVLSGYRTHTEDKALGPDGQPCRADTVGVVRRRPVRVRRYVHIGKETNRLSDAFDMTLSSNEDALTDYGGDDLRVLVAEALGDLSSRQVVGLLDADAARIRTQARRARSAAGHDARFSIDRYQQMTETEQAAAKNALKDQAERKVYELWGEPVDTNQRRIIG